jgi:hypothetical protein
VAVPGKFLFALPLLFFEFSLELAGGFLLAQVAVEVFLAFGGMVLELQCVPFREILDFQFIRLFQQRRVLVALLFLADAKLILFTPEVGFPLGGASGRKEVPDGTE